jgi:DNA-binding response OmpR family regulator
MTPLHPPLSGYSPTLVVDANSDAANQLAEQLNHSGFHADVASSWQAAQAAARARRYDALVTVADLNQAADLECLKRLRKCAPSTWIIVVSSTPHSNAHQVVLQCGADSLLIAPFSVEELTYRLSAFSLRSRPH